MQGMVVDGEGSDDSRAWPMEGGGGGVMRFGCFSCGKHAGVPCQSSSAYVTTCQQHVPLSLSMCISLELLCCMLQDHHVPAFSALYAKGCNKLHFTGYKTAMFVTVCSAGGALEHLSHIAGEDLTTVQ